MKFAYWWREKWVGLWVLLSWKVEAWANRRIFKYATWYLLQRKKQDWNWYGGKRKVTPEIQAELPAPPSA